MTGMLYSVWSALLRAADYGKKLVYRLYRGEFVVFANVSLDPSLRDSHRFVCGVFDTCKPVCL